MGVCKEQQPSALITGATGYVGSHVARRLVEAGWRVHVLVRAASSLALLRGLEGRLHARRLLDTGAASLVGLLQDCRPDVVLHLAAYSSIAYRPSDIGAMVEANLRFGTQLAEAMAATGCSRLVNTGTYSQHYGNREYGPKSLYDATKQAYRDILTYYAEAAGLRVIHLELFDTYGPADPRPKIINLLLQAARDGMRLEMTRGEQRINLIHIEDVAEAYRVAAERLLPDGGLGPLQETYAVGAGETLPLREVAALVEQVSGRTLSIDWGSRPYHPREIMVPWDRGLPLPGWKPSIPLAAGLDVLWKEESRS